MAMSTTTSISPFRAMVTRIATPAAAAHLAVRRWTSQRTMAIAFRLQPGILIAVVVTTMAKHKQVVSVHKSTSRRHGTQMAARWVLTLAATTTLARAFKM